MTEGLPSFGKPAYVRGECMRVVGPDMIAAQGVHDDQDHAFEARSGLGASG